MNKTKRNIKKEKPMGVSQWKEYGKRFGYWKYFKKNTKRIVLKDKIRNQRFGQLLFNAMTYAGYWIYTFDKGTGRSKIIQEKDIFYIENDELEKIIQDYLSSLPKDNAKTGK